MNFQTTVDNIISFQRSWRYSDPTEPDASEASLAAGVFKPNDEVIATTMGPNPLLYHCRVVEVKQSSRGYWIEVEDNLGRRFTTRPNLVELKSKCS